jgi:hypothetical protein
VGILYPWEKCMNLEELEQTIIDVVACPMDVGKVCDGSSIITINYDKTKIVLRLYREDDYYLLSDSACINRITYNIWDTVEFVNTRLVNEVGDNNGELWIRLDTSDELDYVTKRAVGFFNTILYALELNSRKKS